MEASEYYMSLYRLIIACPFFESAKLEYFAGSENKCYVRGHVRLLSGHTLHIAEYLLLHSTPVLVKYRYQSLNADNSPVCRWDNAAHHPAVATHPHHEHSAELGILPSAVRTLADAFAELPRFIS